MAEQTLSIPTIILAGLIGALVIRYFLTGPSSSQQSSSSTNNVQSSSSSSSSSQRGRGGRDTSSSGGDQGRRLREQSEMVLNMFPQVERRDVMYDLTRNGGNVAATTERILQTGVLPRAPASYRAPSPPPQPAQAPIAAPAPKSKYPDLIQRYKLDSQSPKPGASSGSGIESATASGSSTPTTRDDGKGFTNARWSSNKEERRDLLKKRQAEMILKARQKLLEKEAAQS